MSSGLVVFGLFITECSMKMPCQIQLLHSVTFTQSLTGKTLKIDIPYSGKVWRGESMANLVNRL